MYLTSYFVDDTGIAPLITEFRELMGTLTKDTTEIKDMLNPQVTVERGSSVGSDVYKECLASTHYPFVENDDYLLAWTKEKLSSFKAAAIPILVG